MSIVAAGKIDLVKPLSHKEYTELAIFITRAAISCGIGIKLQHNISARIYKRLIQNDTKELQYNQMAYELIENLWYSQSDALFDGAMYNDDFACIGIDKNHSKVIRIQNFFESVFKSVFVKELTFELWDEIPPKEESDIPSIHPKDFFAVLDKAYKGTRAIDSSLIPTMHIKMLR